jgi:ATP-dependent Clp protease ATP-binding subunit ClpA
MPYTPNRLRLISESGCSSDIARALSRRLVGQPAAISAVVPYVEMYRARLTPDGRPAGIFLLLGPTGTGKTKTVEALADVLHGSPKKLLKVDCGEYQMEHEVAKLLGAPPGYLGHRETQPLLTQQKLSGAASENCDLSILLFDEIEKAAQSLVRLLLGVLDKATLRLGDSTLVNFEKSMIFLTSNLGARDMNRELRPEFGFEALTPARNMEHSDKLERIGKNALRKSFPPEFINRIDSVVTYRPLDRAALAAILDQHIEEFQSHIERRWGDQAFHLEVPGRARKFLLEKGTSSEHGARELKRVLQRQIMQPLASLVAGGEIHPGAKVRAEMGPGRDKLALRIVDDGELLPAC